LVIAWVAGLVAFGSVFTFIREGSPEENPLSIAPFKSFLAVSYFNLMLSHAP